MHATYITGFVGFIWRILEKSLGFMRSGFPNGFFSYTKSAELYPTRFGLHAGARSARGIGIFRSGAEPLRLACLETAPSDGSLENQGSEGRPVEPVPAKPGVWSGPEQRRICSCCRDHGPVRDRSRSLQL